MPSNKSKQDISSHIFTKYALIRKSYDETIPSIAQDLEALQDKSYIYLQLLVKCDIHHNTLYKIINAFRGNPELCFSQIITNPYKFVLIPENAMPFEKAKMIADSFSLKVDDETIHRAWIFDFILFKQNQIFIDRDMLTRKFHLDFPDTKTEDLNKLLIVSSRNECLVTLPELKEIETAMGDLMLDLFVENKDKKQHVSSISINAFIGDYEKKNNIKFTPKQNKAIHNAIQNKLSLICGLPGTGKSTISDCICAYYRDKTICLAAPTGIAANNIRQKCTSVNPETVYAGTLHKLLFDAFIDIKAIPDIMIVDEFSMVDNVLFHRILKWCSTFDCKLVLLADDQQLPPIGAGYPLGSILGSPLFKKTYLKDIKRQDQGSLRNVIMKLHTSTRDNIKPIQSSDIDNESVFFYNYSKENITKLINKYRLHPDNCQFITPQHKHEEGTIDMNNFLQKTYFDDDRRSINPPYNGFGMRFKNGDYVVRKINNYVDKEMYANGDIAKLYQESVNSPIEIRYIHSEKTQKVTQLELYEEFGLAYCLTVHKVQGSQFDNVVIIINDNHQYSWTSNGAKKLLYTAISRARKRCIIMGNPKLLSAAQRVGFKPKHTVFLKEFESYEMRVD